MKKVLALLLAVLMLLSLAACGNNGGGKPDAKDVKPADVEAAIAKALGDGYLATVDVDDENMLYSSLNYLDPDKVKDYVAKLAEVTAVNQDEVVVAEVEEGYADEAIAMFNESFAHAISYVRQYPFSVAKVEGARICKVGNLVMMIIAGAPADPEASEEDVAKHAAAEYEKIDAALKEVFGSVPENKAVITEPEDNGGGGGGLIGG